MQLLRLKKATCLCQILYFTLFFDDNNLKLFDNIHMINNNNVDGTCTLAEWLGGKVFDLGSRGGWFLKKTKERGQRSGIDTIKHHT